MMNRERHPSRRVLVASVLAIGAALSVVAKPAAALDSVPSYDGARYLVNRDIGEERWAIAQNLADDTLTGNVFFADGSEPRFVWCENVTEGRTDDKSFSCWGADLCAQAPCVEAAWSFLAEISLSRSFFRPAGAVDWADLGTPVTLPLSFFEPPSDTSGGDRQSGLQITRDGARVLISKDLGGERWAITRNLEDGTVTGNVFFPGGGDPAFLWCAETASNDVEVTLECRFAEAPIFGPIEDGDGNYFVNQLVGDDANDGSKDLPFRTIEGALEAIPAGGKIYVAGGLYRAAGLDQKVLSIFGRSRIELYGSFDPSTWIRDIENFPATVEAGRRGVLVSDSTAIIIDGFTIRTADATEPGESSIGVLIDKSRIITLSRNTVVVGHGAAAAPAAIRPPTAQGGRNGADGQKAAVCIRPKSRTPGDGGKGAGSGAGAGGSGGEGRRGGGQGGSDGGGGGNGGSGSGDDGDFGGRGADGAHGAGGDIFLEVEGDVYPRGGRSGAAGKPGGGGGGGAGGSGGALTCGGGGGGGGGAGAGGHGGFGGAAGGSSVGIAVGNETDVEIFDNVIATGHGERGGASTDLGGAGGSGGSGGDGGAKELTGLGKAGGDGGDGGSGGHGGRGGFGAGGSTIGILAAPGPNSGPTVIIVVQERNAFELGQAGSGRPLEAEEAVELPPDIFGGTGKRVGYWNRVEELN